MKVDCLHGYFKITETLCGDVSQFLSIYGGELVFKDGYFTFADLEDAPDYSLEGGEVLGAPATKTFAGRPWEIFKENELVYDFDQGEVVPLASVTRLVQLDKTGNKYLGNGLLLPGSLVGGKRIVNYAGWFQGSTSRFTFSSIEVI